MTAELGAHKPALRVAPIPPAQIDRFWSKVDIKDPDDCWLWMGGVGGHGYGEFYPGGGVQKLTHRLALELTVGLVEGAHALHSCDVKRCVNPRHLRWGTHAENMAEASERGLMYAPRARRTHCPHGHAMTPENTLLKTVRYKDRQYPARGCRECNRIYLANRRKNRRSA